MRRGFTESRLRLLRQREDAWSMRALDAEERYGEDSPQEHRALERATDYAVEAEMLEEQLEDEVLG